MNKKLILLMLALPLIIMLSLYTTTSTVSLNVKVPVDRLEVHVNDIVELNLDERDQLLRQIIIKIRGSQLGIGFLIDNHFTHLQRFPFLERFFDSGIHC